MDGTTSAVNYLPLPTSNDYYDHHSLQPIQSLGSLSYYQSDTIDCLYEHQKPDFQSPPTYVYHSLQQQQQQQQQQIFGYSPSIYDIPSTQPYTQESNLLFLPNQSRLSSTYDLSSSTSHSRQSTQLPPTVTVTTRVLKREMEDRITLPEKNHVYEWMKGRCTRVKLIEI